MDHALADERTALTYAPEEPLLLMNVAYLHLRRSEYKQSLDYLERARRVAPNNPDVAKLAGWAYYGHEQNGSGGGGMEARVGVCGPMRKCRRRWKKRSATSRKRKATRKMRAAISRCATAELRSRRWRAKCCARWKCIIRRIESELNFTPPDSIGVILYTQQAFADITRAPGWVGALNDGRMRVPVQGLTSVTPELSRVLKHELTHSFVQQKTHGRAPTWMQEGLAQWMEGKRSGENAAVLLQIYGDGHATSLGNLEGSWMAFPGDAAAYAYAWALANIEYIVQADGMGDVERILDRDRRRELDGSGVARSAAQRLR